MLQLNFWPENLSLRPESRTDEGEQREALHKAETEELFLPSGYVPLDSPHDTSRSRVRRPFHGWSGSTV